MVDSESDERVVNNTMRHQYRVLSEEEKEAMLWIKDQGLSMAEYIDEHVPAGREALIAQERIQEAVFWAVHALTA